MPRAPVVGREIRRRSRNGCWNCKARKVKCGEEKPRCSNCDRLDEECDYKIRLSWGGRPLKKKQLENGGSGQDQTADDQTQFIPGAGQFSVNPSANPRFPSPQTFVQSTSSNGSRRPPMPRLGNGRRTTMSNYQTVFSVAEPPAPSSATVDPQLTPVPPPRVPQRPPPLLQTPAASRHRDPSNPYALQQSLTPNPATIKTEQPQQQSPIFSPFTPVSSTFGPGALPTAFQNGHSHSPTGPSSLATSPTTPYGPQHGKSFHTPPPILASSPKRVRTDTSPSHAPPHSPFNFEHINPHPPSTLPPHTSSLARALKYAPASMPTSINRIAGLMDPHHSPAGVGTSVRRVSVENLLGPPLPGNEKIYGPGYTDPYSTEITDFKTEEEVVPQDPNGLYGIDHGAPDMDNDDDVEDIPRNDFNGYGYGNSNMAMMMMMMGARAGGRYSNNGDLYPPYPVPISIPRKLDPLPQLLRENPKNMMYFHHYLKHTARLLVPQDCSANPFKHVLPQMAVETDHLMNLLLAYSASHRARLLDHPEPTERINRFLNETVRSLNSSIENPEDATSDSTLATAIMLSSYQIISPNPFSTSDLTWRTHLSAARKIILARGGAQGMHSRDKVSYFLVRWFAYLDLLGSLSGRDTEEPIFSGKYWTNDDGEDETGEYSVDCFFGFTSRCVSILAKIGELARRCETERREFDEGVERMLVGRMGMQKQDFEEWAPTPAIFQEAMTLQQELEDARGKAVGSCTHSHGDDYDTQEFRLGLPREEDNVELLATNDSFHWAALIHLYRRVLNYPPYHQRVQESVGQIVRSMRKVRQGGTAENCLLFPLFSAGCEAIDAGHREYTHGRMVQVERSGLVQVRHARILMERVWDEDKPWWEIAEGEFIG